MRKLLMLLALAAMAGLAGACGSSEDEGSSKRAPTKAEEPTAVETVRVAYEETAAEQTAKTAFEVTTTGPPVDPEGSTQPDSVTMSGRGIVDFSGAASSMTVEMIGMGSFEVRQVGDTVYMKMPEDIVSQTPGVRPWLEADLDAVYDQQPGANPAGMWGGVGQDPTRQLEYLRGVSDSVEKVGEEEVRGVRTTRYEAVVDLEKEAAGQDEMAEGLGTSKIPVEVWLDEQNRVRRFAMTVTVPVPEEVAPPKTPEGARMRTSILAEYYDFGTPVDVQAPPPDQTTDGSKLFSAQQPVAR